MKNSEIDKKALDKIKGICIAMRISIFVPYTGVFKDTLLCLCLKTGLSKKEALNFLDEYEGYCVYNVRLRTGETKAIPVNQNSEESIKNQVLLWLKRNTRHSGFLEIAKPLFQ